MHDPLCPIAALLACCHVYEQSLQTRGLQHCVRIAFTNCGRCACSSESPAQGMHVGAPKQE